MSETTEMTVAFHKWQHEQGGYIDWTVVHARAFEAGWRLRGEVDADSVDFSDAAMKAVFEHDTAAAAPPERAAREEPK